MSLQFVDLCEGICQQFGTVRWHKQPVGNFCLRNGQLIAPNTLGHYPIGAETRRSAVDDPHGVPSADPRARAARPARPDHERNLAPVILFDKRHGLCLDS